MLSFSGMFEDSSYIYLIEPTELIHSMTNIGRPHIIQRQLGRNTSKQLEDPDNDTTSQWPFLSELPWLRRRRRAALRGVFEEMKYLELMIVNDYKMFKKHRSSHIFTNNFAKSVVNLVDAVRLKIPLKVINITLYVLFLRNVTFHYKRSSLSYFGGICSVARGVGVNEVKFQPNLVKEKLCTKICNKVWYLGLSVSTLFLTVWPSLGNGTRIVSKFGSESRNTVGTRIQKTKYLALNSFLGLLLCYSLSHFYMALMYVAYISKHISHLFCIFHFVSEGCDCTESWGGCIMEETGVYHPRKFSKCSILEYRDFLYRGGGSCLFNRPTKVQYLQWNYILNKFGNQGLESDFYLTLQNVEMDMWNQEKIVTVVSKWIAMQTAVRSAHFPMELIAVMALVVTIPALNIFAFQCPPNLHKQDGFACESNQGRCYNGECKRRDNQCKYIWGPKASGSHKHCYEKLNTEGTSKGNCGKDGDRWIPCNKHDVFCGLLLCANLDGTPRIGHLEGEITPTSFFHQGVVVNCSCAHVLLDDETDLGYVEDGAPCGPNMMCMDRRCLSIQSLNISSCPVGTNGKICSGHGVCSNEATCMCDNTWAGTDCSMFDPRRREEAEKPSGPKGLYDFSFLFPPIIPFLQKKSWKKAPENKYNA
ncbi:hypothetical protein JD844_023239 [Phrynosoma platyrhinos]|uniref:Peptidase M12B domain-containing protein n=1 Tax=Phrynosoma platyrhinos TaxID=52577 RepID=A0ABQ7SWH7_PHRPL|nr:hypothetical protein JD844_023239 [Phrynosoma platyrhinos]